jgi:hypothetical protein
MDDLVAGDTEKGQQCVKKGKAIPVTGRGGPYDCKTSKLPHFLDNRLTVGGKIVTALRSGRSLSTEIFLVVISLRERVSLITVITKTHHWSLS